MARIPIFFQHTFPVETYGALYNPDDMAVAAKANLQMENAKLSSAFDIFDVLARMQNKKQGGNFVGIPSDNPYLQFGGGYMDTKDEEDNQAIVDAMYSALGEDTPDQGSVLYKITKRESK